MPARNVVVADVVDTDWNAGVELFGPPGPGVPGGVSALRFAFGDWALPGTDPGPAAALGGTLLDGAMCMLVLHVLSRDQARASPHAPRLAAPPGRLPAVSDGSRGAHQVEALLSRVARSLKPGAMLIGACVGSKQEGPWRDETGAVVLTPDGTAKRWLHCVASLREAMLRAGFTGAVRVTSGGERLRLQYERAAGLTAYNEVDILSFAAAR